MTREYVPLPTFDVETPFGAAYIVTRGGHSAYEWEDRDGPRPMRTASLMTHGASHDHAASSLTINSVPYSVRIELADYGDGWALVRDKSATPTWHAISGMRADTFGLDYLSAAARRKVESALVPWVIEWLTAHPEAVTQGEHASREQALRGLEEKIERAEGELAELRFRHAAIEAVPA